MTKYIVCDESEMKEFDSYESAIEYAKNNMDETAAVFMQTGMSGALIWKKQVSEDEDD